MYSNRFGIIVPLCIVYTDAESTCNNFHSNKSVSMTMTAELFIYTMTAALHKAIAVAVLYGLVGRWTGEG